MGKTTRKVCVAKKVPYSMCVCAAHPKAEDFPSQPQSGALRVELHKDPRKRSLNGGERVILDEKTAPTPDSIREIGSVLEKIVNEQLKVMPRTNVHLLVAIGRDTKQMVRRMEELTRSTSFVFGVRVSQDGQWFRFYKWEVPRRGETQRHFSQEMSLTEECQEINKVLDGMLSETSVLHVES